MGYRYLINAVLIAVTVFVATVATTATHAEESARNRPFASEELQAAIMSFADNWASQIVEATALLVKRVTMPEVRLEADRFRHNAMAAAYHIAAGPYPGAALLDMLVLVTLNRMVWEEYWVPKVYGQLAADMVTMLRKLEGDIWALAAEVLTPTQRQELRDLLRAWRDKYPDKIGVSFIRFSDFGELGRKPSLEQARKAGGLLAPIKQATQAAEEIRLLGDRALYLLSRMVELVNSRANLTVQELLLTPDIAQFLADVTRVRQVSERYAALFEALPAQLTAQTRALLLTPDIAQFLADVTRVRQVSERYAALFEALPAQLTAQTRATINQTMAQVMRQTAAIIETTMQQVSAERHAAIEQAMGGITQERQGALEQLLEGVSAERRALLVGIEQVLDRGEWNAERWMTHVFVLLAALILVFFVVRLAYRYAADRPVGTPSRRWTACAGLGGIAVLIVVAALAYVQRSLPPRSAASDAEHAARVPVGTSTAPDAHVSQERTVERHDVAARGKGVGTGPDTAPAPPLRQASPIPVQQPSRIAKIKQQGRLTAAVQDDFNPFSFLDAHQQRVGFDVDLMREFARRWLGDADAVTLVPVTTDRRIPTLLEGNVDLIAAALTNTPARQQQIAFSHTYVQDGQRLLVPEHAEVNDMCDLQGKIIVVTRGSTAIDHVQAQARGCGFTAQLLSVASHAEAVVAVLKGEADAFSTHGLALERFATGRPLKVVGNPFSQEPYGVGLPKGDETLRRLVNLTLEAMYADGTLAAMYQKWFQDRVRPYPIPTFNKDTADPDLLALVTTNAPPVFAPVADAPPPSARYVVHQGDTLSRIAGSVYGDGSPQAWKRIYDANKAAIGADPSRLRIGMQLTIPNP